MKETNQTNPLEKFSQFLPKLPKSKARQGTVCGVMYTRVSSKEQFETNGSLESQLNLCTSLTKQMSIPVVAKFGGTFESAKTEERKEFQRMMEYINRSKENIKYIIVSDIDRFSRTGPNAIFLAEHLRAKGIQILAASHPVDTSTPIGAFHQNMQLLFSHFDNQLRRAKTIRGMKQKVEKGYYFSMPPMGYERIWEGDKNKIIINKTGIALRKAFHWKAELRLRNSEISKRLAKSGVNIRDKQLSRIFRNVFYCGLMSNSLLEGKIVEGSNWEALVSKQIFLKANDVLKLYHPSRTDRKKENEDIPLKGFVSCAKCQTHWTGYIVKRKNLYYYKCNTVGCKCNRSAKAIHFEFMDYLQQFEIKKSLIPVVKKQLAVAFENMNIDLVERSRNLISRTAEVKRKIESIEERFVEGEIEKSLYDKYRLKYEEELRGMEPEIQKGIESLSNPKQFIDFAVDISQNLSKIWASGGLSSKIKMQQAVFPEGISYDRENECYRTKRVNSIIAQIAHLARVSAKNKNGNSSKIKKNSQVVPRRGIEPLLPP